MRPIENLKTDEECKYLDSIDPHAMKHKIGLVDKELRKAKIKINELIFVINKLMKGEQ